MNDDLQVLQKTLGEHHDGVAVRDRLNEAILRRNAPKRENDHAWRQVQQVAAKLAGSLAQDNAFLGTAHEAARRLRKNNAF